MLIAVKRKMMMDKAKHNNNNNNNKKPLKSNITNNKINITKP